MTRAPSSSTRFSAVCRGILTLTVLVAVLATAPPAGAQSDEPERTPELEALRAVVDEFGCPELPVEGLRVPTSDPSQIGGTTVDGVADVPDSVQIQCGHQVQTDDGTLRFDVLFRFAIAADQRSWFCGVEPEVNTENDFNNRYGVGTVGESWARTLEVTGNSEVMALLGDPRDMVLTEWTPYIEAFEPYTQRCQYSPTVITCPAVDGFRESSVGQANPNDLFEATCGLESTDEESFDRATYTVRWATDRSSLQSQRRACENFGESPRTRVQVIGGDGTAAEVTIYIGVDPDGLDPAPFVAAGEALRAQVLDQATDCAAAGVNEVFTPLPEYLAAIYTPERVDHPPLPGVTGGGFFGSNDFTDVGQVAAANPAPSGGAQPTAAAPAFAADDPLSGWLRTVLRVVAIAGLVVSILGLLLALLLMRRETRIRPIMEVLRIGLAAVMAIVSITLFARGAPVWAVVVSLAGGGLLGFLQGRNLSLRSDGDKVFAKRGVIALLAFAGGLVLIQIAGLLNRTGVIQMGIALSFASAAITVGLMVGRQPQFAEARRASGVAVLVLLVGSMVAAPLLVPTPVAAQEDDAEDEPAGDEPETVPFCPSLRREGQPRCDAHEALIDLVPWNEVEFQGGLWAWDQKPWVPVEVPRAFGTAPDPITRTIEWDSLTDEGLVNTSFEITETFTFSLRGEDGVCCSVGYEGEGSSLSSREGAEPELQSLVGSLDDIAVYGDGIPGGLTRATMLNIPFDAAQLWTVTGEEECGRVVASTVPNSDRGQIDDAVYVRDGEETSAGSWLGDSAFRAPCEIEGFDVDAALSAAPPVLPRDQRPSPCPTQAELLPRLQTDGFDLEATDTLGPLFTNPNEELCNAGSLFSPLQFGPDAKGATRNELAFSFAGPDNADAWGDDETLSFLDRPSDTAPDFRCATNPNGTAVSIGDNADRCESYSLHKVGDEGGWVMVWVDNQLADGPDVIIRAGMPWGTYRYRCHHCDPSSPEVVNFLGQFHDVAIEWIDGSPGFFEALAGADNVSSSVGTVGLRPPADEPQSDDDATRAAAIAGVLAALASGGMLASALAEAGLSREEFVEALRNDPTGGIDSLLDGIADAEDLAPEEPDPTPPDTRFPPGTVIHDQWGDPLVVSPDGRLDFYDEDAERWRSLPADEAQAIITDQIGELSIYDPLLERRVYFDDISDYMEYEDRIRRQTSGDFWTRTDADWRQRRVQWERDRKAAEDELRRQLSEGRQAVEAWEENRIRNRERAVEGALRAADADAALQADVDAMIEAGDYNGLAELYSGWMYDRMRESQAEADWQSTVADRYRAAELAARTTEAAARTAMVVVTGPVGIGYTAAGLAAINAFSEGGLALQRGEDLSRVGQRMGLGVLAGGRDAVMGRINLIPGFPSPLAAQMNGYGDALEAYARARLDGMSEAEAERIFHVTYTASAASSQAGAFLDRLPPAQRQVLQAGLGGLSAAWSTWMHGGDPGEGFVDGLFGSLGGSMGGRAGGHLRDNYSGMYRPHMGRIPGETPLGGRSLDEALLERTLEAGKPRGVIPIEDQPPPIRRAAEESYYGEPAPRTVWVVDENGQPQARTVRAQPGELQPLTEEVTVLQGLRDPAASRTGKNAPPEVRSAIANTRAQIYERANQRTIARTLRNPEVQAMLRPGDEVVVDTFSTPGAKPSLGADRDARMVIRRTRPDGTVENIEIKRPHWEDHAYSDFAQEARAVYERAGVRPPDDQIMRDRVNHLAHELGIEAPATDRPRVYDPDTYDPTAPVVRDGQYVRDRALAEAHNQLFTDRFHAEASNSNADQAVRWVSRIDTETVAEVRTRLEAEGRMAPEDQAFIRRNPTTREEEFVVRPNGDPSQERLVDPGEWRAGHQELATRLRQEHAAWVADPENNPKPDLGYVDRRQVTAEALRTANGEGTITDPTGARLMWEEKSRFYADVIPSEAIEQSRKGIGQLLGQRRGLGDQNLEVPPLDKRDVDAMLVILRAPHGAALSNETDQVLTDLRRVYGDPKMTLNQALGRVAAAHELARFARPAGTGTPGTAAPDMTPPDARTLIDAANQYLERSEVEDPLWDGWTANEGSR